MNNNFNAIYEKLMLDYFDNGFSGLTNSFEQKAALGREIEFFIREMNEIPKVRLLRSDALYFLITNIVNMVLLPVLVNSKSTTDFNVNQFRSTVKHDVSQILDLTRIDASGTISGHSLVNALSQSWSRLNMMSLEVWG